MGKEKSRRYKFTAILQVGVNFITEDKKIKDILVEKWDGQQFVRSKEVFMPTAV